MNQTLNGSGRQDNGIIKSLRQRYRDAEMKIGEQERQIKWLQERLSYTLVAVNALGKHSNLPAEEAKKIVDAYIQAEDARLMKDQMEVAKQQFAEQLKSGKVELKIVDNTQENSGG